MIPEVTVKAIKEIAAWAKVELENPRDDEWSFAMALALRFGNHYTEARLKFQEAVNIRPDWYRAQLGIAWTYQDQNETNNALEAMEKLNNVDLLSEFGLKFEWHYWKEVLPYLTLWYIELKNFEAAEKVNTKLLEHGLKQDSFVDYARDAAYDMLQILASLKRYTQACELLTDLQQKADAETGNWAAAFFQYYGLNIDFHDRILAVSAHCEDVTDIFAMYQQAIKLTLVDVPEPDVEGTGPDSEPAEFVYFGTECLSHMLACFLARLKWEHGSLQDHENALKILESVTSRPSLSDSSIIETNVARRFAVQILGIYLLSRVKKSAMSGSADFSSIACLKTLAEQDHHIVRFPE